MEKTLYMVYDTEVCNCPKVDGQLDVANGQVYDLGIQIVDKDGFVYDEYSIVNGDVFWRMPDAMREAYFADKRPQYVADILAGKRKVMNTWQMYKLVRELCEKYNIKACIAHNARFDIKVLNATLRYQTKSKRRWFFPYEMPLWDTMKMANDTICKQKRYIEFCKENGYMTNHATPQVRKTAEIIWRYLTDDNSFEEEHTGLADVTIEAQIFAECVRQHKKMEKDAELDEGDM
jgi:hypothetical protein